MMLEVEDDAGLQLARAKTRPELAQNKSALARAYLSEESATRQRLCATPGLQGQMGSVNRRMLCGTGKSAHSGKGKKNPTFPLHVKQDLFHHLQCS